LVKVSDTWLKSTIKDLTKLEFKNGKFKATGASVLRDSSDVRAMQHIYDLWQPEFRRGVLTADKFLNFRTDLAKIAKFERQIGKSQPLESMAKIARGKFNEAFRPQLKGLDLLDKEISMKTVELKRLSKGLVDKEGKLMESAINRIANATGKGKDMLIARLEETAPGITQKIKVLKAIEDIQHASGIKVGLYTRSILTVGAFTSGILPGLIAAIFTSPEMAVPLLRQYGLLKNSIAVKAVANALRKLNESPNKTPAILKKKVNAENFPIGMTIKDVSKGKPTAFTPKANPLIQEAKKYKTAEEFVKAQPKDYVDIKKLETPEFNNGKEVNGWDDIYRKSDAKTRDKMDKDINYLLKDKNNELDPILVNEDGKFLNVEDGHHRVASYRSAGREKIPFQTIKTKSQLTDIWKQENKTNFGK
jgi:hypothetical protein